MNRSHRSFLDAFDNSFFHDFFKKGETDKMDRVVGFLAVLELLRSNKITAEQKKPFDAILIEKKGFGDSK